MAEASGGRRRLAAVWFADIVGYTSLSAENEDAALQVVGDLQRIAREAVEARDGRVVKFIGDAVMTVFDSADSALHAALAVQTGFTDLESVKTHEVALRIGMHLGEVVEAEDGDVYGDGVNTASRVEGAAEPGQVVVTEAIQRLIRNRPQFVATELGERPLKGLSDPMRLYAVMLAGASPATIRRKVTAAPAAKAAKPPLPGRALGLGTAAAVVAFLSLSVFVAQRGVPDLEIRTDTVTLEAPGGAATGGVGNPASGPGDAAGTDFVNVPGADATTATDPASGIATPASAPATPPSPTGLWQVDESTDLLDDSRLVTLTLPSAQGAAATLVVTCRSRRLDVRVTFGTPLTDAVLRVRLDQGRDRDDRSQWTLLPDSTGVTYRGDPRRFLRELTPGRAWVAAAHARSGDVLARFPLRGLDVAGERLRDGCGWP